jgi:periplasmic divalent cation tolerance protein
MNTQHFVVFCTCPSHEVAQGIAERLVHEGLAACVNILPGVTSVYRWQESLCCDQELLLVIKTREDIYPHLETRIRQLHPYTVAEIIALPISQGCREYLQWIDTSLTLPSCISADQQTERNEETP